MNALKTTVLALLMSKSFQTKAQDHIDHMVWDQILLINVSDDGKVNYPGFIRDKFLFDKYFKSLSENYPAENSSKEEKLAYWINLYNAIAMKMIIDNYPVKSINDIENPWKQKQIIVNGTKYSLDDIEHTILRKMNEPRIHFLLNCATKSSPKLWNRAYTARNIMTALEDKSYQFINNAAKNVITDEKVNVSMVFQWYKDDFKEGDIVSFINQYSDTKINKIMNGEYMEYDWSLNERR
ncbi:DUF547 domain-containing protein [uncultured Aquimarina sp.]|uniref:DUF547 domain-containing protein n=1 Tax=uncultured Aquimarina sp. TaxID=575652 RepID=UPI0026171F1D|nr:DUF547 domain-containing protein [uncultured Aquimarina sp.]